MGIIFIVNESIRKDFLDTVPGSVLEQYKTVNDCAVVKKRISCDRYI